MNVNERLPLEGSELTHRCLIERSEIPIYNFCYLEPLTLENLNIIQTLKL